MDIRAGAYGGGIMNVSLAAARSEFVDFAASTGAIHTLTIGLAKQVAADGIWVSGVRPGFIDTEMRASGGDSDPIERVRGGIPLQRGGRPEQAAKAILWLLSPLPHARRVRSST